MSKTVKKTNQNRPVFIFKNGRVITRAELSQAYDEVKSQDKAENIWGVICFPLLGFILWALGMDIRVVVASITTVIVLTVIGSLISNKILSKMNCCK